MPVALRTRQPLTALPTPHIRPRAPSTYSSLSFLQCTASRTLTASAVSRIARRPPNLNSGFSSSYDPSELDKGRGPMFNRPSFGVPQFYPRDLKARVDEYVVGQERAKKTICSAIFNHYQALRRRKHDQDVERRAIERKERQQFARDRDDPLQEPHPVEGQSGPQTRPVPKSCPCVLMSTTPYRRLPRSP